MTVTEGILPAISIAAFVYLGVIGSSAA